MKPVQITDSITTEENPVYPKHCISKVHVELRRVKPECYEPLAVSIGPYYHKCDPDSYPGLEEMQQFKQLYLNSLLERRNRSREYYHSELKKLATKARECYAGPMSTINVDEFTEMMLLDSCFVVEFIRKMNYVRSDENDPIPDFVKAAFDKDDPIGTVQWKLNQIRRDMILLENQLPYSVLSKFYDMTKYDGEKSLEEMAISCFNVLLPRPRRYFSKCKGKTSSEELPMSCFNDSFPTPGLYFSNRASKGEKINHLLHLIHIFCRPSVPKEKKCSSDESTSAQRNDSSAKEVGKSGNFNDNSDQNCPLLKKSPENCVGSSNESNPENNPDSVNRKRNELNVHIGTVVELQEAGVNFDKVGDFNNGELKEGTWNDYVSLFDIEFQGGVMKVPCQGGVMKVPCFKVDASTETLLRNLIAYEQEYFTYYEPKYFTDFAMLMNQLINTENDTKVLRYQKIIINFLPDDKDVSQLFNTLIIGVCDSYKSYFLEERENVDQHCQRKRNIWMAFFKRNYCYNPCVCTSTVAAAILLLVTVAQLIVTLSTL